MEKKDSQNNDKSRMTVRTYQQYANPHQTGTNSSCLTFLTCLRMPVLPFGIFWQSIALQGHRPYKEAQNPFWHQKYGADLIMCWDMWMTNDASSCGTHCYNTYCRASSDLNFSPSSKRLFFCPSFKSVGVPTIRLKPFWAWCFNYEAIVCQNQKTNGNNLGCCSNTFSLGLSVPLTFSFYTLNF